MSVAIPVFVSPEVTDPTSAAQYEHVEASQSAVISNMMGFEKIKLELSVRRLVLFCLSVQGLFLALHSGVSFAGARRPYLVLKIEPRQTPNHCTHCSGTRSLVLSGTVPWFQWSTMFAIQLCS